MNKIFYIVHAVLTLGAFLFFITWWRLSTSFNGPYEGGAWGLAILLLLVSHFGLCGFIITKALGEKRK